MRHSQPLQIILLTLSFLASYSAHAQNQYGMVGAGNATCQYWNQADTYQRNEIISWMKGFASSESVGRAYNNEREFRLEMLTSDYLDYEIKTACSELDSHKKAMSTILFEILERFPLRPE
uniref:HdeA/HdeB family chaperone n=1 Tax=Stutzerimonas stutzeri TaxID=316 RepID=UPI003C7CDADD